MDWEVQQRLRLDRTGWRDFRIVRAARGDLPTKCLEELGRAVQGEGPWTLFTTWVGESTMSAFQGFRVGARSAGAVYIRFEVRRKAYPLKAFELLRESLPETMPEAQRCHYIYIELAWQLWFNHN